MRKRKHKDEPEHRSNWPAVLLLIAVSVVAYWNSFDAPFVFDDLLSIEKNEQVRFGEMFTSSLLWSRSLLYLTFAANHYLHGQQVWGYHLVSLLIHILNGVLVFFIAHHIFSRVSADEFRPRGYALFSAACFLAHPIQTESVTYISSRSELVALFFYLGGVLLFIRQRPEKIGFLFSLIIVGAFVLSMGGKEIAITLPAVLVLYDYIFISGGSFRPMLARWRFYLVFFSGVVAVAFYVIRQLLRGAIGALEGHLSYWQYFLTQTQVIIRYIQLIFVPYGQNLDHDMRIPQSIIEPRVILAVAFLTSILVIGWYIRRRQPVVSFAILWFFITLSPTSSFMPILDVIFEHRLYMPLAGLCLAFPIWVQPLVRGITARFGAPVSYARVSAVIVLSLIVLTIMRNHIWRDEARLWADASAKSPYKLRPYSSLSMAYYKRGEYERAIDVNLRALELNEREKRMKPDDVIALHDTLGNMYLKLRRYDRAIEQFQKVAETKQSAMAFNNLGVVYQTMWDELKQQQQTLSAEEFSRRRFEILSKASASFARSLEIDPHLLWALHAYVFVEFDLGNGDEVRATAEEKLKNGEDFNALYTVATVLLLQNRHTDALPYFERASRVVLYREDHKVFFYWYAYALERSGLLDQSLEQYTRAVKLDPIFIEAFHNMGLIFVKKNDPDSAIANFNEALRADANHVRTHIEIAKVYARVGRTDDAKLHLDRALSIQPGNREAAEIRQQLGS